MKSKNQIIHFVMTGGTIDSHYEGTEDTVIPSKHSVIPSFILGMKLNEKTVFTEVCMKDSRSLSEKDMKNILNVVEKSPHNKIIITHGTYAMPDTAKYLKSKLKRKNKVIIFTGSLIPLVGFTPSDAPFNLGYSIAKLAHLKPGIYVCMNGRMFEPEEVAKLLKEGRFISVFGKS